MNKVYRRLLDIFWLSPWSNQDILNSFLIFSMGLGYLNLNFYSFDLYFSQDFIYSQPNNKEAVCQPGLIVL